MLSSTLGDPTAKVLTDAQLRTLARRAGMLKVDDPDREMTLEDFAAMGYSAEEGKRILALLSRQEQLDWYLKKAAACDVYPITRVSPEYPHKLRLRLGLDAPGCLWAKGDHRLLEAPTVGLVGSRELLEDNRAFAREAGIQAARQEYVLVSGNARGADREAQEACLKEGGFVISVVGDEIAQLPKQENILYLSEVGFDLSFTPQRALHRNAVIHSLADRMLVAQCSLEKGGTWNGTVRNLRGQYSPVFCYDDGSEAMKRLMALGATAIEFSNLKDLSGLCADISLFP